jgi:hypothetical protein
VETKAESKTQPSAAALDASLVSRVQLAVGSLCVLGANIEPVREGARVVTPVGAEDEAGTIVQAVPRQEGVKDSRPAFHVQLDNGELVVVDDPAKLTALGGSDLRLADLAGVLTPLRLGDFSLVCWMQTPPRWFAC